MLPYVPYMDPMILWVYISKFYIQFKPYGNWLMTMPSCGNVNNVLTTAWTTTVIRSLSLGKKEGFLCFSFLCWCCWRVRPPTIYYFFLAPHIKNHPTVPGPPHVLPLPTTSGRHGVSCPNSNAASAKLWVDVSCGGSWNIHESQHLKQSGSP